MSNKPSPGSGADAADKRERDEAFRRGFAIEQDVGAMGGGQDQDPPGGEVDDDRREPDGPPNDPEPSDRIEKDGDAGRRGKVERQEGGGVGGGWK